MKRKEMEAIKKRALSVPIEKIAESLSYQMLRAYMIVKDMPDSQEKRKAMNHLEIIPTLLK